MASKKILYLHVDVSGPDVERGSILSIDVVLDRKTKTKAIQNFSVLVKSNGPESSSPVKTNGEEVDLQRALDWFAATLYDNAFRSKTGFVVGYRPEQWLPYLEYYGDDALGFVDFPFDEVFDVCHYFDILANHEKVPYLENCSLGDMASVLGIDDQQSTSYLVKNLYERIMDVMMDEGEQNG